MLTEREREICDRLRRFREILQIPRARFALAIGVTNDRLTACELGRAPVRYDLFSAVQKHFSINPVWLATGEELPKLEGFSDETFHGQIGPRDLFSSAYDKVLARHLMADRANAWGALKLLEAAADWSRPDVSERLKIARIAKKKTFDDLAKEINVILRTGFTGKEMEEFESGGRIPNVRVMGWWVDILGVDHNWLWTGRGEMEGSKTKPVSIDDLRQVKDCAIVLRGSLSEFTGKLEDLEARLEETVKRQSEEPPRNDTGRKLIDL